MADNDLPEGALPPEALPDRDLQRLAITLQSEPSETRLDRFLALRWPTYSRSTFQKLIRDGRVTVNGAPASKPSADVHCGDSIDVVLYKREPLGIVPEPIPIDVLYEDADLIAVNKRPGILVHPARGNPHGTLVNAVAHHAESLSSGGDWWRPGVVHRLDRDTSGVIVFAKNDEVHHRLARQWERRTVRKEYLAVVEGTPALDADVIDEPVGRHHRVRERYTVKADGTGRRAVSQYEVIEQFDGFSAVRVRIHTGRTHQIRVHMAHIGHRVVADRQYGSRSQMTLQDVARGQAERDDVLIARQALHAARLGLEHPRTGEPLTLEAPLPEDMGRLLEALRTWRA